VWAPLFSLPSHNNLKLRQDAFFEVDRNKVFANGFDGMIERNVDAFGGDDFMFPKCF
jgi:hypothetical protein